jgi:hypothetical protein
MAEVLTYILSIGAPALLLPLFTDVPRVRVLRSSAILAYFATIGGYAQVGSVWERR